MQSFQLEGATPHVPPNHSARKKTKKSILQQTQNMKHRGTMTNENVSHVNSTKHDTKKPRKP
jgi:hypothetical protein